MRAVIFFCCLLPFFTSSSQPIRFQKTIGIQNLGTSCHVRPVSSGGYIMGVNFEYISQKKDFSLIRLDSIGGVIWTKSYNGIGMDGAGIEGISPTSDGGYIFVCSLNETLPPNRMLVKVDSMGNIIWDRVGPWYSTVFQTNDGGYASFADRRLIKTDSLGNILWQKYYYTGTGGLNSCQPTNDNGFIMFGGTSAYACGGPADRDLYMVKADSMGVVQWSKTYGSSSFMQQGYSVRQTFGGDYIMMGTTNANNSDFIVAKSDGSGNLLWVKEYSGLSYDFGTDIQETFGVLGYVVTGYSNGFEGQPQVANRSFLLKLDILGNPLWGYLYGDITNANPGYYDWIYQVYRANDGGFILSGLTLNFGPAFANGYFIKTNSVGSSGCNELFNMPNVSTPTYVTGNGGVDSVLNVTWSGTDSLIVVTEASTMLTLCLSGPPPVGITDISSLAGLTIYPNPTNGIFELSFDSPRAAHITITDLTGRIVHSSVLSHSNTKINIQKESNGLYFVQLISEEGVITKRILKQ